jgi:PKD repeat protein
MNVTFKNIVLLLLYFSANALFSQQIVAAFETDTTKGCIPVVINFYNNSVPDTNLSYFWDFGNGTNSTLKNPSSIYLNAGIYSVSLVVSDGLNSDTIIKEDFITVFSNPTADFLFNNNQNGCLPYALNLV